MERASRGRPLLRIDDVTKRFGGVVALDGLSFELEDNGLQCILGPNGCGKTTLFNVITGELRPDAGRIVLDGEAITGLPPHKVSRRGVARKFQVPGVYSEMSVAENLEVPLAAGSGHTSPWATLTYRARKDRLGALLDLCGLAKKSAMEVASISHGEKQRLEIAMLLARGAGLILLDEPTAGMSVTETSAIAQLIRRIHREEGKSLLVIEHDMNFVRELDCPIRVMMRGRVIASGRYEDVRNDPQVIESYLGAHA